MIGYRAKANINGINWEGEKHHLNQMGSNPYRPISLIVEIKATDLTGLDPTRPITITQEPTPEPAVGQHQEETFDD